MARYARRPSGQQRPPGPWKHGPVPVVGLIGGIGAGKSRAADALAARGAAVLDADAIGHALLDQRPTREQVVARFGTDVLAGPPAGDGEASQPPPIDRKALGSIVFGSPVSLRALEAILHPRMRRTFEKAIRRINRRAEAPLIVLDAAVLLEAGWDALCDAVVFIDAPDEIRRPRVSSSRGWDADRLAAREAAQWPLARKRQRADFVVPNDRSPEDLDAHLDALWVQLTRPTGRRGDRAEPRGPVSDPVESSERPERPRHRARHQGPPRSAEVRARHRP